MTSQQQQALEYFSSHAAQWRQKAAGGADTVVNVIAQRNDYVLTVADARENLKTALDVGCGTGELVWALARRGLAATGVDFAPDMIALAGHKAEDESLSHATFVCTSIFDFEPDPGSFSLISANGFIEYISPGDLDRFLARCFQHLAPSGSLVIGSRNRLFNMISLNAYTQGEIDAGVAVPLLREAMVFGGALDVQDAIRQLRAVDGVPFPQASDTHPDTGIAVSSRFQYTPAQLVTRVEEKGFEVVDIAPIHIHGVGTAYMERFPAIHVGIATMIQDSGPERFLLIPQSSSFMLHAVRTNRS